MHIWAKTILTSYRYLERIADAIDEMVEKRGLYARVENSFSSSCDNVYNLYDKIIELSERKVKLINLKVLTENALERCGESFAAILIAKYIDQKKNADIANAYGYPLRTYFRRLEDAQNRFEEVLALNGFGEDRLDDYLKNERWILEIKNRISSKTGDEIDVEQRYLDKLAIT